jgi:hypothetical protein
MSKQLFFLTSTALTLMMLLFNSAVTAQNIGLQSSKTKQESLKPSHKVKGGAAALGFHEVDLKSIRTEPLLPADVNRIEIKRPLDLRLAPVPTGAGIVGPADENQGLQIEITPTN